MLVCTCVFILVSTANVIIVIIEHRQINVVSQSGIKPGTLQFQDNNETHYATEATSTSNISVATTFIIANLLLYIINILITTTIGCRRHQSPMTSSHVAPDIHSVFYYH